MGHEESGEWTKSTATLFDQGHTFRLQRFASVSSKKRMAFSRQSESLIVSHRCDPHQAKQALFPSL
ncbi:MAG: hypothetical protein C4346_10145 [Chloroflexota bacterium]